MNSKRTHPTPQQLVAFDSGLLPPDDREAVERHVAECPLCCQFLEHLPGDALEVRIRTFVGRSTASAAETPHSDPDATLPPDELPEGLRNHPRYQVLGLLGTGGMGTVYRAVQLTLDRIVAIKLLRRQLTDRPGFDDRFRNEVKALARLNHPNVVAAYDADRAADLHFLVMEYVEGESFETVVARRGSLPVGEACELARQAAVGLQHAHEHGLVHRDIKPANLLLTSKEVVKIADFGLARLVVSEEPPQDGSVPVVLGTPEYMAPEQARDPKNADIRSDLYSLGCTLYFLLRGQPPFTGGSRLQTLLDHQDATPAAIPELPLAVSAVIERLLAKDPAERFSTPAQLAEALSRVVGTQQPTTASSIPTRRRWLMFGGGVVIAASIVGGVIALGGRDIPVDPHQQRIPTPPVAESTVSPSPALAPLPRLVERGSWTGGLGQAGRPAIAPLPRLVERSPLATADQLATMRKQAMDQMVEWVRVNNRWRPDSEIAVGTAARVAEAPAKVDGFELTFGGGLLKGEKPMLISARTGGFFVFELTPEQAEGANLGPRSHVVTTHMHARDARRTVPRIRLSNLRLDDADSYSPGTRVNGTVTCEFPFAPRAAEYLRITHYSRGGGRVMFLYHPKQTLLAGRVTMRFSANPIEGRMGKGDRLVVVYAEWVSEPGATPIIESNTEATLLLINAD